MTSSRPHQKPRPNADHALTISALAAQCGISVHALRFYERSGILNPVSRDARGHRRYRPADVLWLAFVMRLKQTGMPLTQIRHYAALRAAGDATLAARLDLLQAHRQRLTAQIAALTANADALDSKIATYIELLDNPKPRKQP